jgi:hypothetical protein
MGETELEATENASMAVVVSDFLGRLQKTLVGIGTFFYKIDQRTYGESPA